MDLFPFARCAAFFFGLVQDARCIARFRPDFARYLCVTFVAPLREILRHLGGTFAANVRPFGTCLCHVDAMCDRLVNEGFASDYEGAIQLLGVMSDEWFNLLLDEQITAGKNFNSSGLDLRTPGQKMQNIKGSVKQNDKIQGLIQPPKGL